MKTIVICSGGLDSVSLAHKVAAEHQLVGLVSFDYGQRHRKELEFAAACARRLAVPHDIIDITAIGKHLTGSALTDDVEVPDGHYAEETMKATVVPNRNAIMLAIAFGLAAAQKADAVAVAVHGGAIFFFPFYRPGLIYAFQQMMKPSLAGFATYSRPAAFASVSDAEFVTSCARHQTPFAETWSCYKGGERHCGRCGTCVERREAFHLAGIVDPTEYDDPDFWVAATAGFSAEEVK